MSIQERAAPFHLKVAPPQLSGGGESAKAGKRLRFTSNISGSVYLLADLLCLAASAPLSLFAYKALVGSEVDMRLHAFALAVIACTFVFIRGSRNAYRLTLTNAGNDYGELVIDAAASNLVASAVVWQFGMIGHLSRAMPLLFFAVFATALVASRPLVRLVLHGLAGRGAIEQRIAFYGADLQSLELINRVIAAVELPHLRFVGVADDRPRIRAPAGFAFIGGCADLADLARRGGVDQILIAVPNLPRQRLHEIIEALSEVSVDVSLIPAEAIVLAPDYRVRLLGTLPVLNLWQRPFRDFNQITKRAEDLVLGGIALLILAPLMLVCALLVRLSSPGPILFVQPRIGFNNELIHVLKFRTMYADQTDINAAVATTRGDARVTPVGRILRRLSMDELPQLLNVLRGEMSLVGPRPHALEMKVGDRYYHDAVRGYAGRHRVRPGITGLAQVRGLRGEIRTLERAKQRVAFDSQYIEHWSIWLDIRILFATAGAVFFDKYAY